MALQPLTVQMHLLDGILQPSAPVVGLYSQVAANYAVRSREHDVIFLHISLSGQPEDHIDTFEALTRAFVHNFHLAAGSITAALRSALLLTNAHLVAINQTNNTHIQGSLVVAVLRNDELFMVQVGEAYAYLAHSFGLELLPAQQPDKLTPLGQVSGLDIRFSHNWLQHGDLLMLGDPRIAHLPTQKFVSALVGQSVKSASVLLEKQLSVHRARVLLVEFNEEATDPVFTTPQQIRQGPEPLTSAETKPVPSQPTNPVRGRDDQARSEELYKRRKMLEEQARAMEEREAAEEPAEQAAPTPESELPIESESDLGTDTSDNELITALFGDILPNPSPLPLHSEPEPEPEPPAAIEISLAELAANAAPVRPSEAVEMGLDSAEITHPTLNPITREPKRDLPQATHPPIPAAHDPVPASNLEKQSRKAASGVLGMLARALHWLATLLTRFRAPSEQDIDAPRGEQFYATIIAIVIPIIVTLVVSGVLMQSRERNEIVAIRRNLQITFNQAAALETEDGTAARLRYQDVIALADAADDRIEDNADIVAVKERAREALDRLDKVSRLQARTLYRYEDGVILDSIELGRDSEQQNHIFVLSRESGFVDDHWADRYLLTLDETGPNRIFSRNQGVQRHIIGDILDIEWKAASGDITESIVAADNSGVVFSFFPTDGQGSPPISALLGLAGQWRDPRALASYNDRVYILDGGDAGQDNSQIWRYGGDGRGYKLNEDNPSIILPDLADAVDVLIDPEGGNVLILYKDGRLRNYLGDRLVWDETTLISHGLANLFNNPQTVKIGGSGTRSSYYILDPANNRIVEISRSGNLLSQFRADLDDGTTDLFARATDFYVTKDPRNFYVVADNVIAIIERK